jgi:predicted ATPase/DNA-binding SARP family transcriptional activator
MGTTVKFRILGPLEVTVDAVPVPIGGPKPRAVLAVLLLHRGAVVSTDRLVAAVWRDDPPRDAVAGVRTYVSRLRTLLRSGADGERLLYRAPGYLLSVSDDEVDAARFEQLVAAAREHAGMGDHGRTVDLLDAALALWRGPALADLDPAAIDADAELARLEDLRLAAMEERAESLLCLGRSREAVTELDGLVRRFSEREGPAVLLMRALYLSGRQADALTVYQNLRRFLVDELGVEPSEPARKAHRQLLEHDPALTPEHPLPSTNLPRRGTSFVGRADEVVRVLGAVREAPLVTLTGVGGVGKTRLALEVAGQSRSRFPDGVWLCELAPLTDGSSIGHTVAAALRIQQRHDLTIEQSVIEYLRIRKLLLVLDNCEHVLDGTSRLVQSIVAGCPGVAVLATSREGLGIDGEQVWPVFPLPMADATSLFVDRARTRRPDFHTDPQTEVAVTEICHRLDGLPLAIELAAARMRVMSAVEVADRLDDGRLLAGGSKNAQHRHQSLTAAIDWSYRLLSPPEQGLFARLSVFAGGADLAAVHAVCAEPGTTESDTLDLITALVDKSMITVAGDPGGTRYRMLETLRAFGRERLPMDGSLSRGHARYFVELAEQAARGVQGPDERAWIERTLPNTDNFRAAFGRAIADRDVDLTLRLVTALPEVSDLRIGYETADWAERALDLAQEDHPLFVAGAGAAARGAWARGDFTRARALAGRAAGRAPARGTARISYPADVAADVALYEGDVEAAFRHYTSQVALARRDDDQIRLVWTLYYTAICHAVRRVPHLGVPAAQECLRVAESTANPTAFSMARYALGLVLKKSDPIHAMSQFDQAAQLAGSVHNFWWQGIAMMEAAATRGVHGDAVAAARAFIAVLEHWERVGDQTQQWLALRYIVRLLLRLGADENAVSLHHCLLAARKPSPLDPSHASSLPDEPDGSRYAVPADGGSHLAVSDAVHYAKTALLRHC